MDTMIPYVYSGKIIHLTEDRDLSHDPTYKSITQQNRELRRIIDLLVKERSGQPLSPIEQAHVNAFIKVRYGEPQNGGNGK